ncbi:UNVERIFIED_CONTAM: hypothetical protein FKN15_016875 [Acipenser sinensis]
MLYTDYRSTSGPPSNPVGPLPENRGGAGGRCYDPRPPSRLSHTSYAQFNTYNRTGGSGNPNPGLPGSEFASECGGVLDTASQMSYDNYAPTHVYPPSATTYAPYRLGFAAPANLGNLERLDILGPGYEGFSTGDGGLGKYGAANARYSSASQHSEFGQRHQQRMQTHV